MKVTRVLHICNRRVSFFFFFFFFSPLSGIVVHHSRTASKLDSVVKPLDVFSPIRSVWQVCDFDAKGSLADSFQVHYCHPL